MTTTLEGDLVVGDQRFAIVAARWSEAFGGDLVEGAIDTLERHGADSDAIAVVRCPGSFELPQVARRVAREMEVDAIVCLGVLIRGETSHFDWIAGETTGGIAGLGTEIDIPVTFGVLTCETMEQARARSGSKHGNKGQEAAAAAIEMVNLYTSIDDYESDGAS